MLFWIGLALMLCGPLALALTLLYYLWHVCTAYLASVLRIFQEKPLFVVPRGQPVEGAERVRFRSGDGRVLNGCYLPCAGERRGVVLFGLEFGSNCWSAQHYCEQLLAAGYDVFCFETRNQGESEAEPGYEPLQWVTDYEVADTRAAIAYLKARPDADPVGIGFFGISKGAGAGLIAAADEPYVRCAVTDGMFGTETTVKPYMRQWFRIFNTRFPRELIEEWVLPPDLPLHPVARGPRTQLPLLLGGKGHAPACAAPAAHDPRRERQLHQARDGQVAAGAVPASRRPCGSCKGPSTTRASRWPATSTAAASWSSWTRTWAARRRHPRPS